MLIYLVILWGLAEFVKHITYPSAANLRIHTFFNFEKNTYIFTFGCFWCFLQVNKSSEKTVLLAIFSSFDMLLIDCGIRRGYFWSPDI